MPVRPIAKRDKPCYAVVAFVAYEFILACFGEGWRAYCPAAFFCERARVKSGDR